MFQECPLPLPGWIFTTTSFIEVDRRWAGKIGPHTEKLVETIMASKPHPEQGYRSCLGIIRLAKRYPPERVDAACARSLAIESYSYKSVNSILKGGLDQVPLQKQAAKPGPTHENIRGPEYYH